MALDPPQPGDSAQAGSEALEADKVDALVAGLKGIAGAVPGVGGLLGELLGATIPKQRLDRVVDTLKRLEKRLLALESSRSALPDELRSPDNLPVLEEAIHQASRAFSEERREHLANLLAHGLSDPDPDRARQLVVLEVIGELSDEEIVILTWRAFIPGTPGAQEFGQRHANILRPPAPTLGGPAEARIGRGLYDFRVNKLVRLGLLKPDDAGPNAVTTLGRMVLVSIGAKVSNNIPL